MFGYVSKIVDSLAFDHKPNQAISTKVCLEMMLENLLDNTGILVLVISAIVYPFLYSGCWWGGQTDISLSVGLGDIYFSGFFLHGRQQMD